MNKVKLSRRELLLALSASTVALSAPSSFAQSAPIKIGSAFPLTDGRTQFQPICVSG